MVGSGKSDTHPPVRHSLSSGRDYLFNNYVPGNGSQLDKSSPVWGKYGNSF